MKHQPRQKTSQGKQGSQAWGWGCQRVPEAWGPSLKGQQGVIDEYTEAAQSPDQRQQGGL